MRSRFPPLIATVVTLLIGGLTGTTLVMLGLDPVLGALAGGFVCLNILLYQRGSSVDTAGAQEELSELSRTTGR